MKVAVYTFGCKVNFFESETLTSSFLVNNPNIELVSHEEVADYYVVNSCTVTAAAAAQVRNMVRRFLKRGGKVILTGCYVRNPFEALPREFTESTDVIVFDSMEEVARFFSVPLEYSVSPSRSRVFIKIQDGCDKFCSYCIIPYVRGSVLKSVPLELIRSLVMDLSAKGVKEVVLTGIHVGKYGVDLYGERALYRAVQMVAEYIPRVRLSSIDPVEIDEKLLSMVKQGILLPHWHISLQSGSDRVLEMMNRSYDTKEYEERFLSVYRSYPDPPAIGTDVIVGFPGETGEMFEETYEFIKRLPFAYGHVFPFSPRKGTVAYESWKTNAVPPAITKERSRRLRELFLMKRRKYIDTFLGKKLTAVVENQKDKGEFSATTSNYLQVTFIGEAFSGDVMEGTLLRRGEKLILIP